MKNIRRDRVRKQQCLTPPSHTLVRDRGRIGQIALLVAPTHARVEHDVVVIVKSNDRERAARAAKRAAQLHRFGEVVRRVGASGVEYDLVVAPAQGDLKHDVAVVDEVEG